MLIGDSSTAQAPRLSGPSMGFQENEDVPETRTLQGNPTGLMARDGSRGLVGSNFWKLRECNSY